MKQAEIHYYKGSVTGNLITKTIEAPSFHIRESDPGVGVAMLAVIGTEEPSISDPQGWHAKTLEEFWARAGHVVSVHITTLAEEPEA